MAVYHVTIDDFPVATQFLRSKLQAAKVQHFILETAPGLLIRPPEKGTVSKSVTQTCSRLAT